LIALAGTEGKIENHLPRILEVTDFPRVERTIGGLRCTPTISHYLGNPKKQKRHTRRNLLELLRNTDGTVVLDSSTFLEMANGYRFNTGN
jgi:hypothetical protein